MTKPNGKLLADPSEPGAVIPEAALAKINLAWTRLQLARSEMGHAQRNLADAQAEFAAIKNQIEKEVGVELTYGWNQRTGQPLSPMPPIVR